MQAPAGERSVSELFSELAAETAQLVRQEASLATREIGDKVKRAGGQIVTLAVALLVASTALMSLVAALIIGLSVYVPAWLSALIVGVVLAVIAFGLYRKTVDALASLTPLPERAVHQLQRTKDWAEDQIK
ncbi:MAG: phage holin family protein [Polyangiaceae bacterium]